MTKKKKTPAKSSGGYSYDKVVKNKDKNGNNIFFRYEGKKKIRTSAAEYKKVTDTKKYFKTKYKTEWQKKYKSAQQSIKGIVKEQKKKDTKEVKEKLKEEQSRNKTVVEDITTFANSMPTDIETQVLRYGNAKVFLSGRVAEIDKNNLIDVRLFFSELADIFYERWHEKTEAGNKLPSPNILYSWNITTTEINKTKQIINEVNVTLDKTNFSFDNKYFFQVLARLFKNYFGK